MLFFQIYKKPNQDTDEAFSRKIYLNYRNFRQCMLYVAQIDCIQRE